MAVTKVLLVDDSPVALAVIERLLAACEGIEVVGTARDGQEALRLIPMLEPTLICTDYHMPGMDGLALTREVMARYPRPVVVMSGSSGAVDAVAALRLRDAGALEVLDKPRLRPAPDATAVSSFAHALRCTSGVFVFRRRSDASEMPAPAAGGAVRMVAIGASTGGPQAIGTVLSGLPASFPVPVVCVQHIGGAFLDGLVHWLDTQTRLKVSIAVEGERPRPGHVYFSAQRLHLEIGTDGRLHHSAAAPLDGHRPSVTVTFRSVARAFPGACAVVLLTGMGSDGLEGMREVQACGGVTIAQDEASCVVYGMSKTAIDQGLARHIEPLGSIAERLQEVVGSHGKR